MKAKDLAKLLGVSPATVSLVLNNKPGISQSLRQNLTDQIIELGYEDMLTGRGSEPQKSSRPVENDQARPSIVYLSYRAKQSDFDDVYSFYTGVLEGAQAEAQDIDCNLVVIYRQCENNLKKAIKRAGHVIGAVVICDRITDEIITELDSLAMPYVFIDAFEPTRRVNSVNVDNRQSMYIIVEHLKNMGHKDIGYVINGWESGSGEERRIAFRRALKDLEVAEHPEWYLRTGVEDGALGTKSIEEQLKALPFMPTAFATENDNIALRTVNALKRIGLRVPEDVSVVGFDDNPLSRICDPQLTTVRSSRHRIGRECVAMVLRLKRLEETDTLKLPMKIALSTDLVERASVRRVD